MLKITDLPIEIQAIIPREFTAFDLRKIHRMLHTSDIPPPSEEKSEIQDIRKALVLLEWITQELVYDTFRPMGQVYKQPRWKLNKNPKGLPEYWRFLNALDSFFQNNT